MGFIDSDTHVRETDRTWSYMDLEDQKYAPITVDGRWQFGDFLSIKLFDLENAPESYHDLFPRGSVDLEDPAARLRRMDELGVDVHVMFSSWWTCSDVDDPHAEAALARSWNRWVAEASDDSRGRLLWALQVPFRLPDRARQEMEFGKEHGAVGVHLRGFRHGYGLGDPIYYPLYEKAQELDLVIAVHVGGDSRVMESQPNLVFYTNLAPVAGAFCSIVESDLPARFPRLRWAFLEAGASWLPFAVQESLRSDNAGSVRNFKDWRSTAPELLEKFNMFVGCQVDDDLPYLLDFAGSSNLVHGTDYGHMDVGSDPYGLHLIASRDDLDRQSSRAIIDDNARRLWGIEPSFTPAPVLTDFRVPELEAIPGWLGT